METSEFNLTDEQCALILEALYALRKIKEDAADAIAQEAERTGHPHLKRLDRAAFGIPKIDKLINLFGEA